MGNNITELVFIIDKSGSMAGLEEDTIGGFNSMIEKRKKEEGEVLVSTVLFSNFSETLHDRINVKEIHPLTEREYHVGGCTALLDAIGSSIAKISDIHKYIRPEDVPAHTLFLITTDGMENASRIYSSQQVKDMIKSKEESGWEFLFIAANIDAVETARNIGIRPDRAANYSADREGTRTMYACMNKVVDSVCMSACVPSNWAEDLNRDNRRRRPFPPINRKPMQDPNIPTSDEKKD